MEGQRIAFIGSGVMAEVMINGLLTRNVTSPDRIFAAGPRPERAEQLIATYGVRAGTNNVEAAENADIVVLSVKPQTLAKVLRQIRKSIRQEHLVMSVIAGARMATIGNMLGHPAIVRCMPNLPCQIHRGMTIWTAAPEVSEPVRENVRSILQTMGKEIYVPEETDVDRATAVNGTGPALIAHFASRWRTPRTSSASPAASPGAPCWKPFWARRR